MELAEVMQALEKLGSPQTRKVLARHGLPENAFGVKVGDLKPLAKKIKINHPLALELFDTGNADAQYLATYVIDDSQSTKKELQRWADQASWSMVGEYAVAWAAASSRFGWELGLKWIDSKKPNHAAIGWSTLSVLVSITPDEELDTKQLAELLKRVVKQIGQSADRVRYTMNGFVASVGSFVKELSPAALKAAEQMETVEVDMGETRCKVPDAAEMIRKVIAMGRLGKKRKAARC